MPEVDRVPRQMQLLRVAPTTYGMFGVFKQNGIPFAVTLERPWLFNRSSVSCIPNGTYRCLRCRKSPDYGFQDSPKFGDTFQVYGVPRRSSILFHKGNIDQDTHGCICVGEQFELVSGRPGIMASTKGFREFLSRLNGVDEFELEVCEA